MHKVSLQRTNYTHFTGRSQVLHISKDHLRLHVANLIHACIRFEYTLYTTTPHMQGYFGLRPETKQL